MARTARHFVPLDVNYFLDHRVLEAGDAWQLHIAAMLAAKSMLLDGRLTRRQLTRVAPESLPDVASAIAKLVEVGLFIEDPVDNEVITIRSWGEWNDSAADIEVMSKGGKKGNHLRHHVRKGVVKDDCDLCMGQDDSPPDRGPDSPPDPREDPDPDTEETSLAPTDAVASRDELSHALLEVCGLLAADLTESARGALGGAVKDLRGVGATSDEVRRLADVYRRKWPSATLTPPALSKHWATLRGSTSRPARTVETLEQWAAFGAKRSVAIGSEEELRGLMESATEEQVRAAIDGWSQARMAEAS